MPKDVVMPKLGLTMTEGLIVEWKKKEGDQIKKGEILFVLETEKVTYEVESPENGVLGKILLQENETVPVGAVVAYILEPGEDAADLEKVITKTSESREKSEAIKPESLPLEDAARLMEEEPTTGARISASPLAKKTARMNNVDLRNVMGTGPDRMIIREDVQKAGEAPAKKADSIPAKVEVTPGQREVPFTGMRRAIAKKMLASKVETAQTYMSNTVDAGKILAYRKAVLPEIQEAFGVKVTITDLMMKITGAAILEHPIMNTRWSDKGILFLDDVHMGMAMALDEGLIVPVIRDINHKGIAQIAKDRIELIRKGKNKAFLPDDISGSTFTLSAMGMFGVEHFTSNINLPESAILAVGAIIDKPVAVDGEVVIRPMMNVTLSYDHRSIDGAEAGKFMRTLKAFIEDPIARLEDQVIQDDTQGKRITIIGGGVGGYPAAIKAARLGAEVTLIEKDHMGGVCLNRGCIPTKTLLQSGQVIKTIRESEVFGINCGDYEIDFGAIMNRKNSIVETLRNGVLKLLAAKKVNVIKGTAAVIDATTVKILETGEEIKSDNIIIASGSKPGKLSIKGADREEVWDSDRFLEMERLPKKVAIIGGGFIGVEFAQILNQMGAHVTILEMMDTLIAGSDREIAKALEKSLVDEGIKVFTNADIKDIQHGKTKSAVNFLLDGEPQKCQVEKVILSVGRKPELSWLDLNGIGLATRRGALHVDERMETNIPGIYAVGDAAGGIMLAHVAMAEGECAARNAMGEKSTMNYDAIPSCIYTSPEVGSVGMSEEKAREKFDIQIGRFPFHGCGKALVLNETYGMVKIISEKGSGVVLGVHIIGPHATDMIAEAVLGMSMGVTVNQLAHAIHPHPTLSEAVMESALTLCGGAIHMP
jgi:dihydrolipoamide dehydrogenase/pyruvate dehydrogenase complex dihydrolipoamide acetyltransferase long form